MEFLIMCQCERYGTFEPKIPPQMTSTRFARIEQSINQFPFSNWPFDNNELEPFLLFFSGNGTNINSKT